MMPFLSFIKLIPSWAYWLLALIGLCLACEIHGRHAERAVWQAKVVASELKAAKTAVDINNEMQRLTASYNASQHVQQEKAHALPKITLPVDCTVPIDVVRLLDTATHMPKDAGSSFRTESPTKTVTCSAELDLCKRNYAEVCVPNALQLEEIQKQWETVRDKINVP